MENNINKKVDAVMETKKFLDGLMAEDAANELKEKIKNISIEEIEACENDKELTELLNGDINLVMALAKCFEDNNKLGRHNGKPKLTELEYNKHRLEFMKDYLCYFKYAEDALQGIEAEESKIEAEKKKFSEQVKEILESQDFNRETLENSPEYSCKLMLKVLENIEGLKSVKNKINSKGVKVLRKETQRHLKHIITKYIKVISPKKNDKRTMGLYRSIIYTMINNFAKGKSSKEKEAFEIVLYVLLKDIVATKQVTEEKIMMSNMLLLALKHLQDNVDSKIINMSAFKNNLEENVALISSQL